ncbi:hypothetical protein GGD50_005851 [Rhizobium paranaense]|uniref:Uncharacterized protein n=2 Tax=Rhizobium/Agrobacterium group TaxID=227290 RepID=A0A7W8XXJ2_9HYPH|nr:hypothetical protein [Rhizobium paranaense]
MQAKTDVQDKILQLVNLKGDVSMESTRPTIQISAPQHAANNPYRVVEREEVLAEAFREFVLTAMAAGWKESEVALTLADIADDYVMALARRIAAN